LIDGASPLPESTPQTNGNVRYYDGDDQDDNGNGISDLDFDELVVALFLGFADFLDYRCAIQGDA
jgi:hypothetical protein